MTTVRKVIILILVFPFRMICNGQDIKVTNPKNLEEGIIFFEQTWTKEQLEEYKLKDERKALADVHFAAALWVRNNWVRGDRNKEFKKYFNDLGIFSPDDISSILFRSLHRKLNGKDIELDNQIAYYKEYWRKAAITEEENKKKQQSVGDLLYNSRKELNLIQKEVPIIEIPQRELNIFCDEFILFKNGIIINSLNTYPTGGGVGIGYNYFFLDLSTKKVRKITCNQLDIIESIIVRKNQLYISGKKNNKNIILNSFNGVYKTIQTPRNDSNNSWIKLGFYKDKLIALQTDGVYILNDSIWHHYYKFSLDSFNQENGIARGKSIIPTENIRVVNDKLYFVQEIVQDRSSNLLELDLVKKSITEFFSKVGLIDNMHKTIFTYSVDTSNNIYVVGDRLMENNMYLKSGREKMETFIFNNTVKSVNTHNYSIRPRIVINKIDNQLIIAENGVFGLSNNTITPILLFNNQDKSLGYYSCKFRQRAFSEISENKFLLGGLYGGIVLIDLTTFKTEWLDENKIENSIEILELK